MLPYQQYFFYHALVHDHSKPFTPIGYTNWRNANQLFGIKLQDRYSHIYVLGKTGVGKTTLLLNMAIDDIYKNYGVCLIEPHGDACLKLLEEIPEHRKKDIIYFDATEPAHRTGFNPLHDVPKEQRHVIASEIVMSFKKIWSDSWGVRLEYVLKYCILTLLDYPTATLLDITPLLLDPQYRNLILHYTEDAAILSFWHNEYDRYSPTLRTDVIMPILNKAGVFQSNTVLREIVGQQETLDMDKIMNESKILVCNLSKGLIGEDVSQILGSLLTTAIQAAAMRRARFSPDQRKPFMVYIDECHSFITTSFANMLSEVRKYHVSLFLAHQYLEQLSEDVCSAILGNAGTVIAFRLSASDGKIMEQEFYPVFKQSDFVCQGRFAVYIKLLIDGLSSKPFSAKIIDIESNES
ncbi:TraM recognition domain-containing protein [Mucilaginibacter sp. dw_454]|uniref:type IV secretory system conjugative DNA transfer family protein n=1 Tax=Mucilaginibacter sp. dw_454 TaxID=2720079 RepID=UPI001BD3859B|nr:TraM recognition domain-containing protein [Mucilaginibacter sp. dw_454]